MAVLGPIAFFLVGLIAFFATWDGLEYLLGIPSFLAFFLALFLAWFPLLGAASGLYGAIVVWEWEWWQAVLLFFGIQIGALVAISVAGGLDALRRRRS
jgi:hypothetical protein